MPAKRQSARSWLRADKGRPGDLVHQRRRRARRDRNRRVSATKPNDDLPSTLQESMSRHGTATRALRRSRSPMCCRSM